MSKENVTGSWLGVGLRDDREGRHQGSGLSSGGGITDQCGWAQHLKARGGGKQTTWALMALLTQYPQRMGLLRPKRAQFKSEVGEEENLLQKKERPAAKHPRRGLLRESSKLQRYQMTPAFQEAHMNPSREFRLLFSGKGTEDRTVTLPSWLYLLREALPDLLLQVPRPHCSQPLQNLLVCL